jgi:two-component SAPR family response regulator
VIGGRKGTDVNNGTELAGRRVLIVEDEFLLAMELEALLKRDGCEVLGPASTVEWALALIYNDEPDLALLDVNLKGVRATPVAAALRERGVPFVVITGYGEAQLGEPELRAAPRIEKPVNARDLRRAVARAVEAAAASPAP